MEDFFNKPILDQLYDSMTEDFEQAVYEKYNSVRKIEGSIQDKGKKLIKFLEKVIANSKNIDKARDLFREYELEYSKEIDFWSNAYFKLGIIDRVKLKNELFVKEEMKENTDTFLNYDLDEFSDWIEKQKNKYTFGTKEYKELQKRYNEISKKYPNVLEVFENLTPIELTKEEIKALVELREIDIAMGHMEKYLCFKLGMKEVINF